MISLTPPRFFWIFMIFFLCIMPACGSDNTLNISPPLKGTAQLGPLADASVAIFEFHDDGSMSFLYNEITISEGSYDDIGKFNSHTDDLDDDKIYIYMVTGGYDVDCNDDGVLDAVQTQNNGTICAIAKGAAIKEAGENFRVTLATEIYFLNVSQFIEDPEALETYMDTLDVTQIINEDINGDGTIDLGDLLVYDMKKNAQSLNAKFKLKKSTIIEKIHNNENIDGDVSLVPETQFAVPWGAVANSAFGIAKKFMQPGLKQLIASDKTGVAGVLLGWLVEGPSNQDVIDEIGEVKEELTHIQETLAQMDGKIDDLSVKIGQTMEVVIDTNMREHYNQIDTQYKTFLGKIQNRATLDLTDTNALNTYTKNLETFVENNLNANTGLNVHINAISTHTSASKGLIDIYATDTQEQLDLNKISLIQAYEILEAAYLYTVAERYKGIYLMTQMINYANEQNVPNGSETSVTTLMNNNIQTFKGECADFVKRVELMVISRTDPTKPEFGASYLDGSSSEVLERAYFIYDTLIGEANSASGYGKNIVVIGEPTNIRNLGEKLPGANEFVLVPVNNQKLRDYATSNYVEWLVGPAVTKTQSVPTGYSGNPTKQIQVNIPLLVYQFKFADKQTIARYRAPASIKGSFLYEPPNEFDNILATGYVKYRTLDYVKKENPIMDSDDEYGTRAYGLAVLSYRHNPEALNKGYWAYMNSNKYMAEWTNGVTINRVDSSFRWVNGVFTITTEMERSAPWWFGDSGSLVGGQYWVDGFYQYVGDDTVTLKATVQNRNVTTIPLKLTHWKHPQGSGNDFFNFWNNRTFLEYYAGNNSPLLSLPTWNSVIKVGDETMDMDCTMTLQKNDWMVFGLNVTHGSLSHSPFATHEVYMNSYIQKVDIVKQ